MKKIVQLSYVDFQAPLGSVAGPTNLTFVDHNGASIKSSVDAGATQSAAIDIPVGDWNLTAQTIDANTGAALGPAATLSFSVTGTPTTVTVSIAGALAIVDAPAV